MGWGISFRELRGLNAVRLAEMLAPNCSWGISARFQAASYLKLAVSNKHTVADLCSLVWIVKSESCLSKHTWLLFSNT